MELHIINLWQYCVCRIGLGTQGSACMCCVCQLIRVIRCGLVHSSLVNLMRLLAAEPRSTEGSLSLYQYLCRTTLMPLCTIELDWRNLRPRPMLLHYSISCVLRFLSSLYLLISSKGWFCAAKAFELIGCLLLSPSLALKTSYNIIIINKEGLGETTKAAVI